MWGGLYSLFVQYLKRLSPQLGNHVTKKLGKYLQQYKIETLLGFTDNYLIYKGKNVKLTL
jgi:hypothetical protein